MPTIQPVRVARKPWFNTVAISSAPRMKPADMRRLFITGEVFNSKVAHEIGLIDFVTSTDELDSKVQYFIGQVLSSGPIAIKGVKNLIKNYREMDLEDYKEFTVEKISELRVSEEGQEGINAFLEKRKPKWRD